MNLARRRHKVMDPVTSHFGVRERKKGKKRKGS